MILAFCIGFLPIFLSWYGRNFQIYWGFTQYTSSGELAEITSLGPVFSITTIARFWKVIALWHFGWPLILFIGITFLWTIVKIRTVLFEIYKTTFLAKINISALFSIKNQTVTNSILLILFIIPLPAFIISTLSLNKTARYLLPVEVFWLVLISFFITVIWKTSRKFGKTILIAFFCLLLYQFIQGASSNIPELPLTGQIFTTGQYIKTDPKEEKYQYLYDYFSKNVKQSLNAKVYLIPEQTVLNDAELIWYFRQKGKVLNTIGEFSSYTSIEQGKEKLEQTDYVIIDTNPAIAEKYKEKYLEIVKNVREGNFLKLESNSKLNLEIFIRVY
jgi:hypothetical protein